MRPNFKYFLFSQNQKPLYVDNGHVVEGDGNYNKSDGTPASLHYAPDGWTDTLVKYARNIKYWGLFRDFTVPMKFVGDGAKILRDQMWKFGVEGVMTLGIAKLDRLNMPYAYRSWYASEINYSKYKEELSTVTVEALEGGMSKYLKAYENTVFEIPVDQDPQAIKVYFDGIMLDCTFNYQQFEATTNTIGVHIPPIVYTTGEGTRIALAANEQAVLAERVSGNYYETSDSYILAAMKPATIHVTGRMSFVPTSLAYGADYTLTLRTSKGRSQVIYSQRIDYSYQSILNIDATFAVQADEKVFLEANWNGRTNLQYFEDGWLKVDFKNKFDPSTAYALYPYRLFEKIVEKMTDGKYSVVSTWLKTKKDICFLSGDSIRGISGSVIKISLSDFFKALNFYSCGLTIENNQLRIEPLAYFFNNSIITGLGEVKDAQVEPAEDLFFNTITSGCKEVDYDDVNGRFECNQQVQWSAPVTKITRELSLLTSVRTDPYGIEFTRINLEGKKTTDASSDNDTFMVNIETVLQPEGYYKLNRPPYNLGVRGYAISGVPDPNGIFNIEFSPKRALINNGSYIHSILDLLDAQKVKFTTATKNPNLSTTLAGKTIIEKGDIQIGGFAPKLFRPYYFTFTTQVPVNLSEMLNQNPYGKIEFVWNAQKWYGWMMDGGIKPATEDSQQWKLLCAPENDLTKFNN